MVNALSHLTALAVIAAWAGASSEQCWEDDAVELLQTSVMQIQASPPSLKEDVGANMQHSKMFGRQGVQWTDISSLQHNMSLVNDGIEIIPQDGPEFDDIQQGQLGDCYFLAALAVIAYNQPAAIEAMFVDRGKWSEGIYTTEWNIPPWSPLRVAVNDLVPGANGRVFLSHPNDGVMWPLVLEKSFAKIYGSYMAIAAGNPGQVLKSILKVPVHRYVQGIDADADVFAKMQEGIKNKFPMTFASAGGHGIVAHHAYGILDVSENYLDYGKCVRVYNPWNFNRYEGTIKNQPSDQGDYWITYKEYFDVATRTYIAHYISDNTMADYTINLNDGVTNMAAEITATDDKPFVVQLQYPDGRFLPRSADCTLKSSYARVQLLVWRKGDPVCVTENQGPKSCFGNGAVQSFVDNSGFHTYRADMPGGTGEYLVYVVSSFPRSRWLPAVQLSVYGSASLKSSLRSDHEAVLFKMTGLCNEFSDDVYGHFTRVEDRSGLPMWRSDKYTFFRMEPWGYTFQKCSGFPDLTRFPPQEYLQCADNELSLLSGGGDCKAVELKHNSYCKGDRKPMGTNSFGFTLETCTAAVESDSDCTSKRFDFNAGYGGQCKCAKGTCSGFNGAGGYNVYGIDCYEQTTTTKQATTPTTAVAKVEPTRKSSDNDVTACHPVKLKDNGYCQGGRKGMGSDSFGFTLETCMAAVESDSDCTSKRFDFNAGYGGQCKCATGTCSGFGGAGGYNVYGIDCYEQPTTTTTTTVPNSCTKWAQTFGYNRGMDLPGSPFEICASPVPGELWTWKQCAARCAEYNDDAGRQCDFWLLQIRGQKKRSRQRARVQVLLAFE